MGNEQDPTNPEEGRGKQPATEIVGPETEPTVVEDPTRQPTVVEESLPSGSEPIETSGFGRFGEIEFLAEGGMGQILTGTQSERDRATFICRVLGRLGLPECVKPLGG